MDNRKIPQYSFYTTSTIGIEAKRIDFLWKPITQSTKKHRVDFYHLIWIKKGKLAITIDFEELILQDNDAFLICPGQICHFDLPLSSLEAFSVLFIPDFLGEATTDAQLLHKISGCSPLKNKIIPLHNLPIHNLIEQLIHELNKTPDEYQSIIARSCLRILLAEIARRIPDMNSSTNKLAIRFFNEVEKHFERLYNVNDYLPLLAVQEKTLSQAIRIAIGMTPKTYIDTRRMLEAKRLLAYSNMTIKGIAFALGFEEATNFNKFFRKHAKITPNSFRIKQKKE